MVEKGPLNVRPRGASVDIIAEAPDNFFHRSVFGLANVMVSPLPYLTWGLEYQYGLRVGQNGARGDNHRVIFGVQVFSRVRHASESSRVGGRDAFRLRAPRQVRGALSRPKGAGTTSDGHTTASGRVAYTATATSTAMERTSTR